MKSTLPLALLVTVAVTAVPAHAQQTVSSSAGTGVWRLANARHVTPTGPGRSKQQKGTLVSDSQRQELAFDTDGKSEFTIPFERIDVLHYEEDTQRVLFWHHSTFYVAVHYTDAAGEPAAEAIRVSSRDDAIATLATLEQETGRTVDRTAAIHSFRGIPIRAAAGSKVVLAGHGGEAVKATITHLSSSSVTVDAAGASQTFDETEVSSIRLQYSPAYDAKVGFMTGAISGAAVGGLLNAAFGGSGGEALAAAGLSGAVFGGIGALVSVMEGATLYPHNKAFDVYRAYGHDAPGRVAVRVAPQFSAARRGLAVTIAY